jgi:nitrile hydratase subunit beta
VWRQGTPACKIEYVDGIHDLGGLHDFGAVAVERDEPVFHERWEGRVFGMAIASLQRITQLDEFRHAIERMDPVHYLTSPYYEHLLSALATLLVEKGIMAREAVPDVPLARPAASPHDPPEPSAPVAVGDRVRVRDLHARGHTRCPRYVRGRCGTVVRVDHEAALPDQAAHARPARRELTYAVRFESRELWGDDAEPGAAAVCVGLWRSYLEPVP